MPRDHHRTKDNLTNENSDLTSRLLLNAIPKHHSLAMATAQYHWTTQVSTAENRQSGFWNRLSTLAWRALRDIAKVTAAVDHVESAVTPGDPE